MRSNPIKRDIFTKPQVEWDTRRYAKRSRLLGLGSQGAATYPWGNYNCFAFLHGYKNKRARYGPPALLALQTRPKSDDSHSLETKSCEWIGSSFQSRAGRDYLCSPASVQFAALGNCAEGIALAFTETIKRQSSSDGVLEVFFVLSFECLGLRTGRVDLQILRLLLDCCTFYLHYINNYWYNVSKRYNKYSRQILNQKCLA